MATNLSKDWTLEQVLGILRVIANEISPDKLQDPDLIDFLHLAICDVAELLGRSAYPDYGKRIKIFFQDAQPTAEQVNDIWIETDASNKHYYWDGSSWTANANAATAADKIIDISMQKIHSIVKLVDDTLAATVNGLCIEKNQKEFHGLPSLPQKQDNVFWVQVGERIYFYDGTNLTARSAPYSMHLFYNRIPEKVTVTTDTIDIRDKYAKLVIDKTKLLIYENLGETAPESLTGSVNASVENIRQSNLAELGLIKGKTNLSGGRK